MKEEMVWKAERDADALLEYEEIKKDSKRYANAIKILKKREKDLDKKLKTTKKLISKKDVK